MEKCIIRIFLGLLFYLLPKLLFPQAPGCPNVNAGNDTVVTCNTTIDSCSLPANLQNGLVAYYPFCGNADDKSGNNHHGTVNGATLTTDRFGNINRAYSFDGQNDFIEVTNVTNLDLYNTNYTRSFKIIKICFLKNKILNNKKFLIYFIL